MARVSNLITSHGTKVLGFRTTNITYISTLCGTIHLTVFYGNVKKFPYIELLIDA